MKRKHIIVLIIILLLIFVIVYYLNKQRDEKKNVKNVLDIDTIVENKNIPEVDYANLKTTNIELKDTLTIKKGGVYILTGTINDGQIYIDTKDNVKLILNNVNITNTIGPAIMIENANQVYIELASDSVNYLTDSDNYSSKLDEEINAVVFSKDDLILGGSGKLVISSHYQDGIVSKDNLKIVDGTYEISSIDDAIRGKDSLVIINGNFDIDASGDGLKSTNDTNDKLGYILIENGSFNIIATNDGIQAASNLVVKDGNFNIKTGSGSSNSSLENVEWGKWSDPFKKNNASKNADTSSAKGLKASENIIVNNGKFIIDSSDDAIHSNSDICISNGSFTINSGDDGIHADSELVIDGGNINIEKSYEGLEAEYIIINDGTISIVSSDDGINAAGGNDASSMNNRPGMNNFEGNGNSKIEINDGIIYINASGDGIDANGSIYMNGGTVIVNGPTDNGNGAVDYDKEFKITNGTFVGSGSSGMAQGFSNNSTQNSVMINFSRNIEAGELVSISDSDGLEIFTYKADKNYQNLVISMPNLKLNTNYIVYIGGISKNEEVNGLYSNGGYKNGNKYTTFITINSITNVGNIGNVNQGMNMKPNGPGRRP